jgi:aspartate racemase
MKTLGIIGGVGPGSTIEYYRTIIALYQERTRDGSYPQFIINSIDLKRELELITANDLSGATKYLIEEVQKLARAGADFGLIASNTPHIVFDAIRNGCDLPLLSIVEVTCEAVKARQLRRPALFGTRFTMQGTFYPVVFAPAGIELVLPDAKDQEYIHSKYMNELVPGNFLPETRNGLLDIIDRMREERGIDSVILGGTELPLILRDAQHHGIPLLDTMRIHAEAAVKEMFS